MRTLLVFFMSMVFAVCANALTFDQTIQVYLNKDFDRAYKSFQELASLGNTKAQVNIAVMFARGESVQKSLTEAYAWAKLAHNNGEEGAKAILDNFAKNLSIEELEVANIRMKELEKDFDASILAKKIVPKYTGRASEFKKARSIFRVPARYPKSKLRSHKFGIVDITGMVGKDGSTRFHTVLAYEMGAFEDEALKVFKSYIYEPAEYKSRSIATFGNWNRFVFQMHNSELNPRRVQPILNKLEQKAINGSAADKYSYSRTLSAFSSAFEDVEGFDKIALDSSHKWRYEAGKEGFPLAKYELGLNALHGNQCDDDIDQSLIWLQSAANSNLADANMIMGFEYVLGARFAEDVDQGFFLMEKASGASDHARVLLAWLLVTYPDELRHDYRKAADLLSGISKDDYTDMRSYYEAKAAVHLGEKDYRAAKKALKSLSKINDELNTPKSREEGLLEALKSKKTYIEQLL